jgi:hypothetical protein
MAWIKENPKATALIAVLVVCLGVEAGALRECSAGGNANTAVGAAQGVSTTASTDAHLAVVIGKTQNCPEIKVTHDCVDKIASGASQQVTVAAQCPAVPAFRLSLGASVPVYPAVSLSQAEIEGGASYHRINVRIGSTLSGQVRAGASYTVLEF